MVKVREGEGGGEEDGEGGNVEEGLLFLGDVGSMTYPSLLLCSSLFRDLPLCAPMLLSLFRRRPSCSFCAATCPP